MGTLTIPQAVVELLERPAPTSVQVRVKVDAWARWLSGMGGTSAGLDRLVPLIDRAEMCRLVDELIGSDDVVGAFVVTMAWGHGPSGYGPFRTAQALSRRRAPHGSAADPQVVEQLVRSVDVVRQVDAVEGFRYLNNTSQGRIKYLGPAFFTKWLYAVTAWGAHDRPDAAPILDRRVLTWVNGHTDLSLRSGRTDDYRTYVDALASWGQAATPGRTAVGVEEAIFAATAER